MGQLEFPIGDGERRKAPQVGRRVRLTVLVDYRPTLDEVEMVEVELPPEWGGPEIAHMVLTLCWQRETTWTWWTRMVTSGRSSGRRCAHSGSRKRCKVNENQTSTIANYSLIWGREAAVRKSIEDTERELREAGHVVEREYRRPGVVRWERMGREGGR